MRFELLPPDLLAIQVETKNPDVAEVTEDVRSIGDRRLRSETVFQVNGALWPALMDLPLPHDSTALQIKAQHLPLMNGIRWCRAVAAKIESLLRLFRCRRVHDGGQKNSLAPHDRRRPAASGQIRLPSHVLGRGPTVR